MSQLGALRVLASLICALGALWAQDSGAIEGRVVNSVTQAPVEGVTVRIWDTGATNYAATSDSSGAFRVGGIKTGVYMYRLEKQGYIPADQPNPSKGLRVSAAGPVRVDVQLTPSVTLTGRIFDAEGNPAPNVEVQAGDLKFVTTNAEGRYTFNNLEPGSYTLLAKPPGKVVESTSPEVERTANLPTYFPSAVDRAHAQVLNVQAGAELSALDIQLRTGPVYRVRGIVLDEAGKAAEKAAVALTSRAAQVSGWTEYRFGNVRQYVMSGIGGLPEAKTVSGKDGAFEFSAVPPGEWSISAEEIEWDGGPLGHRVLRRGSENLLLDRQDADNIELRLAVPFHLPVEADWGDAPPGSHPPTGLVTIESVDDQLTVTLPSAPVAAGPILPGRYRIAGGPPVNGYIAASVLFNGRDVLGQAVDLQPGSGTLRVVYRRSTTSLRGSVDNGPGATVLYWPQVSGGPVVLNSITVGANGNFEGFLPPGDYYVLAVDRVDTQSRANSELIGKLTAAAQRVSIAENATFPVQLPLTAWPP